jgi:hypothetical protein
LTTLKCSQEKEVFKEARSGDKDDSPPAVVAATTTKLTPKEDGISIFRQQVLAPKYTTILKIVYFHL